MASNIFVRHSLAAAKRPLLPFQLGKSTFTPAPHSDLLLTQPLDTALSHTYTHTHTTARRSTTNFAYVPGGRTSQLSTFAFAVTGDDMGAGHSDLQGHRERPDDLPAL